MLEQQPDIVSYFLGNKSTTSYEAFAICSYASFKVSLILIGSISTACLLDNYNNM